MSKYIRKTVDTWQIWTNYGYGWELECIEMSRKEARENVRAYRENAPGVQLRVIKKREPINEHVLYECGICGSLHRWAFDGDCRNDRERFDGPIEYCDKLKVDVPLNQIEIKTWEERQAVTD